MRKNIIGTVNYMRKLWYYDTIGKCWFCEDGQTEEKITVTDWLKGTDKFGKEVIWVNINGTLYYGFTLTASLYNSITAVRKDGPGNLWGALEPLQPFGFT